MQTANLLSPQELAAFVGVPLATIYRWNHLRTGPAFVKVGRHVRYRPADVESWMTAHTHD